MDSQIIEEQQDNNQNSDKEAQTKGIHNKVLRIRSENIANEQNDLGSISSSKMNIFCRLDRFLRRWLPGYNYLRGGKSRSQINLGTDGNASLDTTGAQMTTKNGQQQQQLQQQQRKTEVYLDTGIAKSEFCVKLENILKSKLQHKQEQNVFQDGV